ncbi:MAG: hypothetical protein IT165_06650 [Bryobacterales bacterium]|nr:hypothetical protein [Bryobacterales bacterium]
MSDSDVEVLRVNARRAALVEAELQRRLAATRAEIDEHEADPGEMEEKRRCLHAEKRELLKRIESVQWERGFLAQKIIAAESGKEAARVFEVRILTTV